MTGKEDKYTFMEGMVSVIVPVYNAGKFLRKCVECVTNQSYKNLELILVNDGSTDESEKICNELLLGDKRIRLISQGNGGPASARNTGIANAAGEFVFFLDADDLIELNTLEVLVGYYDEYKPDLVMSNFCKVENDGKLVNKSVSFYPGAEPFEEKMKILSKQEITGYVRHFLKNPSNHLISYCWARLYKLSIIKQNNIVANKEMRLFEDFVFNLEYLKYTEEIVFVNEPLYIYIMHNEHVSASMVIINSESLLHDLEIFKNKTDEYLQWTMNNAMRHPDIDREIGHTIIHYIIIFMIRSCRQMSFGNYDKIFSEINKIVSSKIIRKSLRYYSPSKGNSRILPVLMELKLITLIMFLGRRKALKRYGKMKGN